MGAAGGGLVDIGGAQEEQEGGTIDGITPGMHRDEPPLHQPPSTATSTIKTRHLCAQSRIHDTKCRGWAAWIVLREPVVRVSAQALGRGELQTRRAGPTTLTPQMNVETELNDLQHGRR